MKFFEFLRSLFPLGGKEFTILCFYFTLYISIGVYILYTTSIIDYPFALNDIYLAFDNSIVYHVGTTASFKHPLMVYITKPLLCLGNMLNSSYPKSKGILFLISTSLSISLSVVYVYRYLVGIVYLSNKKSFFIASLFALSNTCLYLSFTTESYPYAMFLLTFSLWYFSFIVNNNLKVSFIELAFLSIMNGAITITNAGKVLLISLFCNNTIKTKVRNIFVIGVFLLGMLFIGIVQYPKLMKLQNTKVDYRIVPNNFKAWSFHWSKEANGSTFRKISDKFFGSPVFMPQLTINEVYKDKLFETSVKLKQTQINIDFYSNYLYLTILTVFYSVIVYCCWMNRKNKLLWMILTMAFVDVFIHVIMNYAVHEGFIFSGHWIFVLPLILGWGVKVANCKQLKIGILLLLPVFFIFLLNNVIRLYQFIELAQEYYPPM